MVPRNLSSSDGCQQINKVQIKAAVHFDYNNKKTSASKNSSHKSGPKMAKTVPETSAWKVLMNKQVETWDWTSYIAYSKRANAILLCIKREPMPCGELIGLWKLIYPSHGTCPIRFRVVHNVLVCILERWQNSRKGRGKTNKSNSRTGENAFIYSWWGSKKLNYPALWLS